MDDPDKKKLLQKQEMYILKCAKRMVEKQNKSPYLTLNGVLPKPVRVEIERMKAHCRKFQEL